MIGLMKICFLIVLQVLWFQTYEDQAEDNNLMLTISGTRLIAQYVLTSTRPDLNQTRPNMLDT